MEDVNIHSMIKERFSKLPPKLQEAITSTEVADKLRTLSQKYHLHIDQGQILENETYMILLGIEQAEKYEENLKKELKVPTEEAKKIAKDVTEEIFLSIRNLFKESTTSAQENEVQEKEVPEKEMFSTSTPMQTTKEMTRQEQITQTGISVNPPATDYKAGNQNKLESTVKTAHKEIEITPTKHYTVDPYREPIE